METKLAAAAVLAVQALAFDADVSRVGASLSALAVFNSPGVTTPHQNFGLTVDPEMEPKMQNYLTPLGQRQQYLIGSELRYRYVTEAQFLDELYEVTQCYMQTPFSSSQILSMQAQMMGLYPASKLNTLTEWQQGNAVPPIEGATFDYWQEQLGDQALPYGLNVFPIQQVGMEVDYMLSLNTKNCARYAQELRPQIA